MTENLKKFIEMVRENKQLAAQTKELQGIDDRDEVVKKTIEIAGQHGFRLTPEDFEEAEASPLHDEELEAVAGGGCGCPMIGQGFGNTRCVCGTSGEGYHIDDPNDLECFCFVGGAGWD